MSIDLEAGIRMRGVNIDIPNCTRDELPQFFKDRGYKVGVEVGVYKGEFTEKLLKAGLTVYGVDPWSSYEDYGVRYYKNARQERQNALYAESMQRLAPYANFIPLRKTSMEAADDFQDNSIDFVYIDGHHGFKYVAEDLWEWTRKVRPGGIISGHDYAVTVDVNDKYSYHVKYAVDGYVASYQIGPLYILGRKEVIEGELRDKWRSWMFEKK